MGNELAAKNQEFGSALVAAAREKHDQEKQKAVLEVVKAQIKLIDDAREAQALLKVQLEHYEQALKAVERGEFTFTANGKLIMQKQKLSLGHWNPPGSFNYGG